MHRSEAWTITVYGREHGVPHFHIEGPDFRCSVAIGTLEPVIGTVPSPVLRAACGWARQNQALLLAKWWKLNR